MSVYLCGTAGGVPKQLLYVPKVRAIFQQMGRKTVSQAVEIEMLGNSRTTQSLFPDFCTLLVEYLPPSWPSYR